MLLASIGYLYIDRENCRDAIREEYKSVVDSLQRKQETIFIENANILQDFNTLKEENVFLKNNRLQIEPVFKKHIAAAKQKCDTVIINKLDSIHTAAQIACNLVIDNLELQVDTLQHVIKNDSAIIALKDSTSNVWHNAYLDEQKLGKKGKIKSFFKGFGFGFAAGFTSRSFLFRPK